MVVMNKMTTIITIILLSLLFYAGWLIGCFLEFDDASCLVLGLALVNIVSFAVTISKQNQILDKIKGDKTDKEKDQF